MKTSEHQHPENLIRPGNEEYLSYYHRPGEWKPTKPIGPIGAMNSSPGPAIVELPTTIGTADDVIHDPTKRKAPAFKIGVKDSIGTCSYSPGPAAYDVRKITNKGSDICHAPIVGEKFKELKPFVTPGPAAYKRENSDRHIYRKVPEYSMRPRREPNKGFITPAPSSYTLPDAIGTGRSPFTKSAAYTIGERLDKASEAEQNRPGPTTYVLPSTNVNKTRPPAFTMRTIGKDPTKRGPISPGPGSSDYHMVKLHKPSTPRFSFGVRHTPYKAFQHFAAEK